MRATTLYVNISRACFKMSDELYTHPYILRMAHCTVTRLRQSIAYAWLEQALIHLMMACWTFSADFIQSGTYTFLVSDPHAAQGVRLRHIYGLFAYTVSP